MFENIQYTRLCQYNRSTDKELSLSVLGVGVDERNYRIYSTIHSCLTYDILSHTLNNKYDFSSIFCLSFLKRKKTTTTTKSSGVCPVLCSGHGHYGGGLCHCEEGYKGAECEIPAGECQVPGCSGHGRCIEGECHCERGFKGDDCSERKLIFVLLQNISIKSLKFAYFLKSPQFAYFSMDFTIFYDFFFVWFAADCLDPACSGHGTCVNGQCYCKSNIPIFYA